MKKIILFYFLFFLFLCNSGKPLKDDKDGGWLLDVFIKNIVKKSEMKKKGEVKEFFKEKAKLSKKEVIKKKVKR